MILTDVAEFLATLPPNRAICGLDLGDKTIGFAVSDLRRQVATPVLVIRRVKFTEDAARLLALLACRLPPWLKLPRRSQHLSQPR